MVGEKIGKDLHEVRDVLETFANGHHFLSTQTEFSHYWTCATQSGIIRGGLQYV